MNLKKTSIFFFFFILFSYSFYRFVGQSVLNEMRDDSSYILLFLDSSLILLGLLSVKIKRNKFILILLILFFCFSTLTYFLNADSVNIATHLNGLREILIIFSAILFISNVLESSYNKYFNQKIVYFLYFYLIVQIPICFYQFSIHGAGDMVGGGFGGGGSGTLTLIIFICLFFLLTNNSAKIYFKQIHIPYLLVLFLIPTFLNETKITFILLPLLFLLIVKFKTKNFFRISLTFLIALTVVLLFNEIYFHTVIKKRKLTQTEISENPMKKIFTEKFLTEYFINPNVSDTDVSRITKIQIASAIISENYYYLLFGRGFGIFKGGSEIEISPFSRANNWLLEGSIPFLFFLILQGGLLNTILIIILIMHPIIKSVTINPPFAIRKYGSFLIIVFLLVLIYNPAFRHGTFTILFTYFSLYLRHYYYFIPSKKISIEQPHLVLNG